MADERTFVLVGASLAGAKAAETLRAEGFAGRVVLVGAERELPYERPPLSKGYLAGTEERSSTYVHEPGWYEEQSIELRLGTRATGLDPSAHEVQLDTGERLGYDKLLLATGSRVLPLDVPGADADGVLYLRELADCDRLKAAAVGAGRRVVIVGGGWIGLEVAAVACQSGAEVTVLEREHLPLARVLGDEVATVFRDLHVERGVRLLTGTSTREVRTEGGRAVGVVTGSGAELPADAVVVGVGVRPEVALAESGGLTLDNGVAVDASLRTSDPDVYAAGDVANADRPLLGRRLRVEHWANALDSGPVAARAMLGHAATVDFLPFFFSDQYDLGMEYAGWADPKVADVVIRGDAAGRAFYAFWLEDGKVMAGMHANMWDEGIEPVKALVTSRRRVDPGRLSDPAVAFTDL
jgi:3-phenylpropionate/trans-cinnamate dioxygenase ferredoxin reductase subunit